jgi:hypothetical protein
VADLLLHRFGLPDTTNDILALCPGTPDKMVLQRQDVVSNAPFEACPTDPAFTVTATVQDQSGLPIPVGDPFTWSTNAPGILGLTPHGDYATVSLAGGIGPAVLSAHWTTCPEFPGSGNVYVGVAPRLVGTWLSAGTISQVACQDPFENFPPTYVEYPGEIEAQITNPNGSVTFNLFGIGWEGVATLACGGPGATYSGSDPYYFEGGYGLNTYSGTLSAWTGPPGRRVATNMSWSWEANDIVGDTCHAAGSGSLTRLGQ